MKPIKVGTAVGTVLSLLVLAGAMLGVAAAPDQVVKGKGGAAEAGEWKGNPDPPGKGPAYVSGPSTRLVKRPVPGGAGKPATVAMSFPTPINCTGCDNWEPDVAADTSGHVYMVFKHYDDTSTAGVNEDRVYIQRSSDGGATFSAPQVAGATPFADGETPGQEIDATVTTDPQNAGHVYVAFMAYGGTIGNGIYRIYVAKSTDYGATFAPAVKASAYVSGGAGVMCKACDHEWITAYNGNVYVTYADSAKHMIAVSTNGGASYTETSLGAWPASEAIGFSEDAVVDSSGNAWTAYVTCVNALIARCGAAGGNFYISKTTAGTGTTTMVKVGGTYANASPDCPYASCGYEYFGLQNDIAIDAAGTLYMVVMANPAGTAGGPPRTELFKCASTCTTATNWTSMGYVDDKAASGCAGSPPACYAMFPRIDAGDPGEIVVMWLDDRRGTPAIDHKNGWNAWWRTSLDGGTTWESRSHRLSRYKPTFPFSQKQGFMFPYGDYMDVAISPGSGAGIFDCSRVAMFAWGEGKDYAGSYGTPAVGGVIMGTLRCLD